MARQKKSWRVETTNSTREIMKKFFIFWFKNYFRGKNSRFFASVEAGGYVPQFSNFQQKNLCFSTKKFMRHYLPVIIIFMPHLRISLSKISITSSKNLLFASRQFNGVVQYAGFSECSAGVKSNEFDGWISCSTSTSDSFELYSASPVS